MMFMEIIAVFSKNHTEHLNTRKMQSYLMWKYVVHMVTSGLQKLNPLSRPHTEQMLQLS